MRTLGVDLAASDATTAACVVVWEADGPRIDRLVGRDVGDDTIVELSRDVDVTGIDAPFGWPRPFTAAVAAYAAGAPWPREKPDGLWLRLTDLRAHLVAGGRTPLSVSSDRIARPAERAARLLTLLGCDGRPCRRDGSDDVIEVYPAGALRCWGIPAAGYKRSDGIGVRDLIVATITDALGLIVSQTDRDALVARDDALDALVAALVAGAFGQGRAIGPEDGEQDAALSEGWLYLPRAPLAALRTE